MADNQVAVDDVTGSLLKALMGGSSTVNSTQNDLAKQAASEAKDVDVQAIIQAALDKAGMEFAPNMAAQAGAGGYNSKTLEMLRQYAAVQGATQGAETAAKLQLQKAATIADAAKAAQGSNVKTGTDPKTALANAALMGLVGEGAKYVKGNYKDLLSKVFGGQGGVDNGLISSASDILTTGANYGNEGYGAVQDYLSSGGDVSNSSDMGGVTEMFTDATDGSYTAEELQAALSNFNADSFYIPFDETASAVEDVGTSVQDISDMLF